jgi:peptidoglycan/xylan/chitin deacetylase (PgdA/CDA1 family)
MLFFSDEDHVVPPDVIACHERAHAELGRPGVVVGNVFGRRGAVSIVPEDRPEHKRRILEGLRWSAEFPEIAARVATGQRASLSLSDGPGVWEYVGRAAFTEIWMRRWAEILVRFGENLEAYPHRWTRLTAGSLSMPAAFFRDLGGFAEDIEAMEDWEMGARLQRRGGAIACAPEAEPYHLIHPVDQDRRGRDLQSYTVLKKVHPDLLAAVMSDTSKQASPARDTFCHFEEILATQVPTESASSSDSSISRLCSLTFDDGPHPLGTPTVLQILSSYDVKATFFCVGQSAAKYSELVKAIAAEGHELGIHGWTHTSVDAMTDEELKLDIQRTRETLESLSGKPVRFIRPTYGRATAGFLAISRELGLEVVNWHTSTEDWLALRPEDIIFNLAWQGVINKVILFHDGSGDPDVTRQALQWLLAACQRWNCSVTPLENLIRSFPVPSLRPLSIERWTDFAEW